jgi:hypothetical protein
MMKSCGAEKADNGKKRRPEVTDSSTTIAFSGNLAATVTATASSVEGDRFRRTDQHQNVDVAQELQGHVDRIGNARRRRPPSPALGMSNQHLVEQRHVAVAGDPPGKFEPLGQRRSAAQHHADPAGIGADGIGNITNGIGIGLTWRIEDDLLERSLPNRLAPGRICRQDQRCHARRRQRSATGGLRRRSDIIGAGHPPHPVRHRPRQPVNVAGQRRIERQVIRGMVADDVDHRRTGSPRVVHVGKAIGQSWPGMQQRGRRPARHPRIAVRGTGNDILVQPENAAQLRLAVERSHEMHLRRAGIGEADIDAVDQKHVRQHVGPVAVRR